MKRSTLTDGVVAAVGTVLFIPGFIRVAPGLFVLGGYNAAVKFRQALSH